MTHLLFDKTPMGRDEIASRQHQLSPRLRALLLLIDGRRSKDELVSLITGIDLDASLRMLLDRQLIRPLSMPNGADASAKSNRQPDHIEDHNPEPQDARQESLLALYRFYADTIQHMLGVRGFVLQRQLERATCLEDLRALEAPYLQAVRKAAGEEAALGLGARLHALLERAGDDVVS